MALCCQGKLDTETRWRIGTWSPGLMFLKGKLCSLRVAVSTYVLVSLSVDPSQVSLEWLADICEIFIISGRLELMDYFVPF